MEIFFVVVGVIACVVVAFIVGVIIFDRMFQGENAIIANFPLAGRMRYVMHELRPLFRQYFGDDDAFVPRSVIDWILHVSEKKSGYFSFDKFDTTGTFHDPENQMIHSATPLNVDETEPEYPVVGAKRKHPLHFHTFFYRSAMSLGSLSFEATQAMSKGCADANAVYNTGEGSLSVHHIPNVSFSYDRKFFRYRKVPKWTKYIWKMTPGIRLKHRLIDFLGKNLCSDMGDRDLYLFDESEWLFYTIDWDAPLEVFPKPEDLTQEYGQIVLQVGSGLYGMRKKSEDGSHIEIDWDRFQKTTSFCRAVEIKLAQGAKQTGGILKASKNTSTIAHIRGVQPGIDLVSPNRFPFYEAGKEAEFLDFMEKVSDMSGGKPVGCKLIVSDKQNITPLIQAIADAPEGVGPDFITVDGGDGGSATAPLSLGVLFGKKIYDALHILHTTLEEYGVRDQLKVFASSKLYAPHMSARALALGADAVGNARSIMIAGGCIRAGLCSGEGGVCPVGMATMKKSKRRGYEQVWKKKSEQIKNYITAHNKGLIQVGAVAGLKSPNLLDRSHIVMKYGVEK